MRKLKYTFDNLEVIIAPGQQGKHRAFTVHRGDEILAWGMIRDHWGKRREWSITRLDASAQADGRLHYTYRQRDTVRVALMAADLMS